MRSMQLAACLTRSKACARPRGRTPLFPILGESVTSDTRTRLMQHSLHGLVRINLLHGPYPLPDLLRRNSTNESMPWHVLGN